MKSNLSLSTLILLVCMVMILSANTLYAGDAPPNMAAGLIIQLAAFEKNTSAKDGDVSIHIIGSSNALADEMKRAIGTPIAKRKLTTVTISKSLPESPVDILVISNEGMLEKGLEYCRTNKIMSTTDKPEFVEKGVTLGIGMNETGGQTITLNLSESSLEGLDWKPAILKIAKTIK